MKSISKYIILLFILGQSNVNAQSDMVMLRPIDFSPGMVGNKGTAISLSSGNITIFSGVRSYNASLTYECFSEKLKGGIGVSYSSSLYDIPNLTLVPGFSGKTSSQRLNVVYAPKFVLNRELQFSPFIKLSGMQIDYGIFRRSLDHDAQRMNLRYDDKHNVLAGSLGFLINKQKWFFGLETYGLNTLLRDSFPLSRSIGFKYQAGMFFKFTKDHKYGVSIVLAQDFSNTTGNLSVVNNSLLTTFRLNQLSLLLSLHRGHGGQFDKWTNRVGLGYQPTKKIKVGYSLNLGWGSPYFFNVNHQVGFQYIIEKKDDGFF